MGNGRKKGTRKPLRRAQHWTREVPRMAGRLAVSMIVVVIAGLMLSAIQGIETFWLRAVIAGAIVFGMLALFFMEGLGKGTEDAAVSRMCMQLEKNGKSVGAHDDAACYHPLKAALMLVVLFAVPLLLAIYLCAVAKPYTYGLQDLPTWLTGSYGARGDIMGPLGAYEKSAVSLGAAGWVRVFVRLLEMNFINLFPEPLEMTSLIDRLSPLMIATYPIAYLLGYLCGPRVQRKRERQNRRAKKVAVRKAQKSSLAKELVGEQNAVHYGQRRESEKPKRKELI